MIVRLSCVFKFRKNEQNDEYMAYSSVSLNPRIHLVTMGGNREAAFRSIKSLQDYEIVTLDRFVGKELAAKGYKYPNIGASHPTDGEVGCLLSHQRIWTEMAHSAAPSEWWIVCEDDSIPCSNLQMRLQDVAEYATGVGVDFVYLNHMPTVVSSKVRASPARHKTKAGTELLEPSPVYGTAAYMLTSHAAQIMLETLEKSGFLCADDVTWLSWETIEDKHSFIEKWKQSTFYYQEASQTLLRERPKFSALACSPYLCRLKNVRSTTTVKSYTIADASVHK